MSINSKSCRSDAVVRSGIAARLAEIQTRADAVAIRDDLLPSVAAYVASEGLTTQGAIQAGLRMGAEAARTDVPALTNAVESVMDYVARCEESGITMQPGDVRHLIAAALGGAS